MRSDICVVQETLKDPGIQLARWFKGPPAERGIRQDLQYVASVPDTFFVSSPEE